MPKGPRLSEAGVASADLSLAMVLSVSVMLKSPRLPEAGVPSAGFSLAIGFSN